MTQTIEKEKHRHKERLYDLFSRVAGAMANPHRLELLDLLAQGPRTVEELAREARMGIGNTSQHLQRLKQVHLVRHERDGLYVRYQLADPAVASLWIELRHIADRQLAEVGRALESYRQRRHEFQRISMEELRSRLSREEVFLIDVRPSIEYESGHLPGSVSIPLQMLEGRLDELPSDKMIVIYCRGPYCGYADEALHLLAGQGWEIARLEEGVIEWQLAGYDVE